MAKVVFGTDEQSYIQGPILDWLRAQGHELVGLFEEEPWPDVGRQVGELVSDGTADWGVICCWTGTGVSIAANKVPGVRAALCTDVPTAVGARRWNDANVLAMGVRLTSQQMAVEMLEAFASTAPDNAEAPNIDKLT